MRTVSIAHTDLKPTRVVFGCMTIGKPWDGSPLTDADRKEAFQSISAALEAGITMFDHADIYARGNSEALFGDFLRAHPSLRELLIIQSKCGIRFAGSPNPDDPGRYDFSYEHITESVHGILRRLSIERLDILLLHRPDPLGEPDEVARAFDDLHASGKVRYFGVSNHTGPQIDLLRRTVRQPLVVNQLELSLTHHHLISEGFMANRRDATTMLSGGTLEYCRAHEITVQAWSPVGGGRALAPELLVSPQMERLAALLRSLGKRHHVSPEAIMLAWLLRHPAGIQPVIGSTRPERIAAAREADGVELLREEWYALLTAAQGHPMP